MKHFDEAKRDCEAVLKTIASQVKTIERVALIDDIFGKMRVVFWAKPDSQDATRAEIKDKLDSELEAVVLGEEGLLEVISPGAIIAIHSTILPKTAKKISEIAKKKGVAVLDAQISGGEKGAREKTLCYMVGGDKDVLERCRPIFATSAAHIFHMGEVGMGATTKIIQQVIVCINMLAAAEGFLLAHKTGVDFKTLQQIIQVSAGQSFVADHWFERFKIVNEPVHVKRQRVEVFYKSLSPALELAHELGVSLPGGALAQQLIAQTLGVDEK
jgi:3-hydroxyisobutyrate dehydrogenase-like beta-hydroxyacid dehydrogenase